MPLHRPSTISRDWYNPLKGLAMSRIVAYEDAAERGQYADLQWLWRLMEQTDVTVQAAIARRLSFIDSIDWEIRAVESALADSLPLQMVSGERASSSFARACLAVIRPLYSLLRLSGHQYEYESSCE